LPRLICLDFYLWHKDETECSSGAKDDEDGDNDEGGVLESDLQVKSLLVLLIIITIIIKLK
jgi:hypothetical protein